MEKIAEWIRKNSGTLLAVGVALLTALVLFMGGVRVRLGSDALRVSATTAPSLTIDYDDIRAARLAENIDLGSRISGMRGERIMAGQYLNDEFGRYRLYAYARVPVYIDLTTEKGHVVFNAATEEQTRSLYDQLLEKLPDIP